MNKIGFGLLTSISRARRLYAVPSSGYHQVVYLEPGGVVGLHSQKDRPTVLHVIKGTLTSHPQGRLAVVLRTGDSVAEGRDGNYWVQNTGSEPAAFIWLPVYESTP